MFCLCAKKDLYIAVGEGKRLIESVMRFSFLTGYRTKIFDEAGRNIVICSGTVMSLDPNSVKHYISIDYSEIENGKIEIKTYARVFPWEKSKMRQILSHRLAQLTRYFRLEGMLSESAITKEEEGTPLVKSPFTHLSSKRPFSYVAAFLKVLLSMSLCVFGAILVMFVYGFFIIGVRDSRLFLEVAFGTLDPGSLEKFVGGSSVIGIAIGSTVGLLLGIYFALSEAFSFLNKRILAFGIFYACILCFFIIEEEAVIVTSILAMLVPLCSYTFYYLVWGLKKVYIKKGGR